LLEIIHKAQSALSDTSAQAIKVQNRIKDFNAKTQADQQKNDVQRENNEIQREKITNDKLVKDKQLELQERKIVAEDKRTRANVRVAKVKSKEKKSK